MQGLFQFPPHCLAQSLRHCFQSCIFTAGAPGRAGRICAANAAPAASRAIINAKTMTKFRAENLFFIFFNLSKFQAQPPGLFSPTKRVCFSPLQFSDPLRVVPG